MATLFGLALRIVPTALLADPIPVTNLNDSGPGSLRQALQIATPSDWVDATGITGTITLTSGELVVPSSIDIAGPGADLLTISGNGLSRVLNCEGFSSIAGLTIADGVAGEPGGGGILSQFQTFLYRCVIRDNQVDQTSSGGGILALRSGIMLFDCTISGNRAGNSGGGIASLARSVSAFRSTITGNSASQGAGISASGNVLELIDSTIARNSAGQDGGGVLNQTFIRCLVQNSTVTGNTAYNGGGIMNAGTYGTTFITHSTISGNDASFGGGIANLAPMNVHNSTISGNRAAWGGGIRTMSSPLTIAHSTLAGNSANTGGGLHVTYAGPIVSLTHTLVAGNGAEDLAINQPAVPIFVSGGYNLIGNTTYRLFGSPATFVTGNPTDLLNVDPLLGPLQDNGGPTFTHALLAGSPARDAGDPASTLTVDQRGLPRPVNGRIDIGAFEAQCDIPTVAITSPTSGAVFAVNTEVTFTATFTGENAPHTATWTIDGNVVPGVVDEQAKTVTATVTFSGAGVYPVQLTLANDCGNSATSDTIGELPAQVVVYDPSAGFVTGGGWINSPAGAANWEGGEALTGKASFGFVSRYKKGQTVPTGETEFQFKVGDLKFKSTSYQWLVVSGARAQYKGDGTVNGVAGYGFLLTATDGQLSGGGGTDKFRIKIWDASGVVYDNQLGADDGAAPTTPLGGGSIVIHK